MIQFKTVFTVTNLLNQIKIPNIEKPRLIHRLSDRVVPRQSAQKLNRPPDLLRLVTGESEVSKASATYI